jgi:hypothetical protein
LHVAKVGVAERSLDVAYLFIGGRELALKGKVALGLSGKAIEKIPDVSRLSIIDVAINDSRFPIPDYRLNHTDSERFLY